jgi:uncharacterized RDD family membrane protein YckC
MGFVSVAAAMPATTTSRSPPLARGVTDGVLRVRATGFGRRFLAAATDAFLLGGFTLAITLIAALALGTPLPRSREIGPDLLVAGILDRNPMTVGALGLFCGITVLYELYCAGIAGQTIGMRLVRIRLISSRGSAPGAVRGLIRVLAFAVSVLPGCLGWLWAIFDREHRALHDHLAGTYLILDL